MDGGIVVEREQMRLILSYPALIERLKDVFASASLYSVPDRHHHDILDSEDQNTTTGTLLLMPAWSQSQRNSYMGVKIVTVFPNNVERGLASVLGLYVLSCGRTGRPLALMNGTELTLWRTACASALAGKFLVKTNARTLAMLGAGALAPHLIQAHLAMHPSIATIVIWNRGHGRAIELADTIKKFKNLESTHVYASSDRESVVRAADIISCATMSEIPLVLGKWLQPGCHLDLVGAYKLSMRECDDEAVAISRVFIDSPSAISESGDLYGPISRKVISRDAVIGDLADLAGRKKPGRQTQEEITLFKSVGCALEDLAAAQLIYETCRPSNVDILG